MTDEPSLDAQPTDLADEERGGLAPDGAVATELRLMRALADVGERMNAAATSDEVGAAAIDAVRQHLGARGGALAVADHSAGSIDIVRVDGYDRSVGSRLRAVEYDFVGSVSIPLDAGHPIAAAIRDATVIVDLDAANHADVGVLAEITGDRAFAVMPLELEGTVLGALYVAFTEPTRLSRAARTFLEALVLLAADALRRTTTVETDRRLGGWLARIHALSQELSAATTFDEIAEMTARWFERNANASLVEILLDDSPAPTQPTDEPVERRRSVDEAVERARRCVGPIIEAVDGADTRQRFAARLRDGVDELGVLVVEIDVGRPIDDDLATLLDSVATQLGSSIRRAVTAQRDTILVDSIATQVVPDELPRLPGIELAAVYVPAETRAGGDWYDAFSLPDGRIGLVIGDVAGHGPEAAAAMTNVRTATRAEALHGSAPASVLAGVDAFLCHFEGMVDPLVTEVVVSIDPGSGSFRYSNGGHPPPLLVHEDGHVDVLDEARGLMLGTEFAARYELAESDLEEGSALVLYTDGLVERRDEEIEAGLDRLVRGAPRLVAADDLTSSLRGLVEELLGGSDRADDVAVLVAARPAAHSVRSGRGQATFRPEPASTERARALIADLLGARYPQEHVDDALLLTSELATNVVRHARTVYDVSAVVDDAVLRVEVVDLNRSLPYVIHPEPDEPHGRGMLIVDRVAHRWGAHIVPSGGKVVWFELDLGASRSSGPSSNPSSPK